MAIYKYLPEARSSVLSTLMIRFSQPAALNDPFECLPLTPEVDAPLIVDRIIKEQIEAIGRDSTLSVARRKRNQRDVIQARGQLLELYRNDPERLGKKFLKLWALQLNRDLGILSLSRRADSPVMWAHYCSYHRGFVIGFDETHSFFQRQEDDPPDLGVLTSVSYSQERVEVHPFRNVSEPFLFLRKSSDWDYEKEMRLIRGLCKRAEMIPSLGDDLDIYLFRIPPNAIQSIVFGMDSSPKLRRDLVTAVNSNPALSHVRFFVAKPSKTAFTMDAFELKH